jgi:hypothetical protein
VGLVLGFAGILLISALPGATWAIAPKKGYDTVGYVEEDQVLSSGTLVTEPMNWNTTPTLPSTFTMTNGTFDNISGGSTYSVQIVTGELGGSSGSIPGVWISFAANISGSWTIRFNLMLAEFNYSTSHKWDATAVFYYGHNASGDNLGDLVVSNFSGTLSAHLTELASAYYSLGVANYASSNSAIKSWGSGEQTISSYITALKGDLPSWVLSYSTFTIGGMAAMMPMGLCPGPMCGGGFGTADLAAGSFNWAACWAELVSLGVATYVLATEIIACWGGQLYACLAVFLTVNLLPETEIIAICAACNLED